MILSGEMRKGGSRLDQPNYLLKIFIHISSRLQRKHFQIFKLSCLYVGKKNSLKDIAHHWLHLTGMDLYKALFIHDRDLFIIERCCVTGDACVGCKSPCLPTTQENICLHCLGEQRKIAIL